MSEEISARMRILEMIDSGKITAAEGLRLLQAISGAEAEAPQAIPGEEAVQLVSSTDLQAAGETGSEMGIIGEAPAPPPMPGIPPGPVRESPPVDAPWQELPAAGPDEPIRQSLPPEAGKWRLWWTIPLWVGAGIAVIGALFMVWAAQSAGPASFGFFCASVPLVLGLVVVLLAIYSRTWPWLHLRVQQAPGETPQRIAISMPIPVRPLAWGMRVLGNWVPEVREHNVSEILMAVGKNTNSENPIFIQVDDEDGEKVEIYIG